MTDQSLNGNWQFRQAGADEWQPAVVPGGVHTDLLALGRIPDPFVADNELHVQWVAESDWEYRLIFDLQPGMLARERIFLVCEGLDTLATVTLNEQAVGSAENAFRTYRWDVTGLIAEGENELRTAFGSPVGYVRPRQAELPLPSPTQCIPGGPHLRKAPSQFGWDWGPQLPPIGVWKDVRLETFSTARLENVHVTQRHDGQRVSVHADLLLERWRPADLQATLTITSPAGEVSQTEVMLEGDATCASLSVAVADPQLWWPNGYGDQALYEVEVSLLEGGARRDGRRYRVGLRTLELRQEPDEFGTSFTFIVNGVPVFAKGANWIPADSFPTRITDEHLAHLIRSSAQANMNMLRVWGGGFYEEERFYDLCDRFGIMVWQDFIFSCAIYPGHDAFLDSVRVEALENVRRLRHRASLALWCGNNEMEWAWDIWGWNRPEHLALKKSYDHVFHHLLPEVCAAEDPDTPYWPSSPSSDVPFEDPNSVIAGDTHNWEVWHRNLPFAHYREHPSRFVSEFGFQSLPAFETIRSYASEADWNMTSYIMEHHQRNAAGNGKMITYMTEQFRLPRDFESLVYLTQLLQAEAMRVGVEYWRRNCDCTSGALYWQLNDCWPVASWASLDYFGRWKALHYAARRFFASVLLSAEDEGTAVSLHVTNDQADAWQGRVRWSLETLAGDVIDQGEERVQAPSVCAVAVRELDLSAQVTSINRREVVLVHELWQGDERLSMGVVPFVADKHLKLQDPGIRCDVIAGPGGFEIELTAERLARYVWLELPGSDVVFSDNYFDIPAGRTVRVSVAMDDGVTVGQARSALRIRSLSDSY